MITRRRLVLSAIGVAGLAALGWEGSPLAIEAEIASVLRRRLSYLDLDDGGVRAFSKDVTGAIFAKKIPTWGRLRYHFLSAVSPSFKRFYRSTDARGRVGKAEDQLVATYLLSSDFFINGADESRKIGYIANYDPMRPCQNPFARPVAT